MATRTVGFGNVSSLGSINVVNNSRRPFSEQKGWKLTQYGKDLNLDIKLFENTHENIGERSKHGTVERLVYRGNRHAFVMKTILFKSISSTQIFDTEIKVGQMKDIYKVGPRVIAHRRLQTKGQYIMDNVEMGSPHAKVHSLYKLRKVPNIMKSVYKVVEMFHKITGGQHGDLHGGNILVVKIGEKVYIRIIDYGAFKSLKELATSARKIRQKHGPDRKSVV